MEERFLACASEIEKYLSGFGPEFLFRGQVTHFTTNEGGVSLTSSQGRKGCDPPSLFKWTHYASEIISFLRGETATEVDTDLAQAVLQHYGWRSLFVDLTANTGVAAWFASHGWSSSRQYDASEDCSEHSVVTAHECAFYAPTTELGHIYIISRSELRRTNIRCVELSDVIPIDLKFRFKAQHAWLAGPIGARPLPISSIIAHISAPASELAAFAKTTGFGCLEDLFPRREEDAILDLLLDAPRQSNQNGNVFLPALQIPEYDSRLIKPFPPRFAFYRSFWLADDRIKYKGALQNAMFVRVSEHLLYTGRPLKERHTFPLIAEMLKTCRTVVIESDGIEKLMDPRESYDYAKGLYLRLVAPLFVEVSELRVEHPGVMVTYVGTTRGWYYRITDSGSWVREEHDQQCPCGHVTRHLRHLWALQGVEDELLRRPQIRSIEGNDISLLEAEP